MIGIYSTLVPVIATHQIKIVLVTDNVFFMTRLNPIISFTYLYLAISLYAFEVSML